MPQRTTLVELHRQVVAARSRGDVDTLAGFLSDNVVLHVPGRNKPAGDYPGREGFLEFLGLVMQLTDGTAQIDVQDIFAGADRTVDLHRLRARRADGRDLDATGVEMLLWHDDKIVESWHMAFDLYALDEFFS